MYEIVEVGEEKAGEANQVRKELEGLIESWNKSTLDIGELLYTVKTNGYYKSYGFNTFLEYVSELNIKTRKAQYLTRIVDVMSQVGIGRENYEDVGIAKLREITSLDVIDENGDPAVFDDEDGKTHFIKDIITGLVEKAPGMDLEEIKNYVRIIKGFTGDNDIAWINICVNRQALEQTIQPALNLSKQNLGTAKKDEEGQSQDYSEGKALEVICIEYLNDPANQFMGGQYVPTQS